MFPDWQYCDPGTSEWSRKQEMEEVEEGLKRRLNGTGKGGGERVEREVEQEWKRKRWKRV